MKQTNRKGFTLAELLIVVAIIAVLVAIAIPVFTTQLHNAKASADMANIRAYYAELQLNYQETGEYNTSVPDVHGNLTNYDPSYITMLNGNKIDLQVGIYTITFIENKGYHIWYVCNNYTNHPTHDLILG